MTASKAAKRPSDEEKATRKTVTFRMEEEDRKILYSYAIKLSAAENKRYSNNAALAFMIEHASVGTRVKVLDPSDTENQKLVTYRLSEKHKQLLTEYGINVSMVLKKRISNNEALRYMLRAAKVSPAKKSVAAAANA